MAQLQHYSCECLNIRISGETNSRQDTSGSFVRVKARDDDVQVSVPQFTIRKRTHEGETEERIHYTTMTCLLCQTLAYRVQVQNPADGGPDGLVLSASAEWSDKEPLLSKDSWLDVSSKCRSGTACTQMLSSPNYSAVFSLLVPRSETIIPAVPTIQDLTFAIPSLAVDLPPLFLAPPFTPAHPVFQALSRYAVRSSEDLRKNVDVELETFLNAKLKELTAAEEALRRETDVLWKRWRTVWDEVQKVDDEKSKQQRIQHGTNPVVVDFRPDVSSSSSSTTLAGSGSQPPKAAPRSVASPSLLSASLAQAPSLHQRMALAATAPSVSTSSLEGISPPPRPDSALGHVRLTDDSFAVAASFKLSMVDDAATIARLEKAQARRKEKARAKEAENPAKATEEQKSGTDDRGRNHGGGGGGRRVQFADDSKEDSETGKDESIPEIPMFDIEELLDYGAGLSREASVTPIPSPRSKAKVVSSNEPSETSENGTNTTSAAVVSVVQTQMMDIVGAHLPSHRTSWAQSFKQPHTVWPTDRESSAEDTDENSADSTQQDWKNPSTAATSLPVTMGSHMQNGVARQPKSSAADRPGVSLAASIQARVSSNSNGIISSSVAARERVYAVRDMKSSVDPGPALSAGPETIEEEEEEDEDEDEEDDPGLTGEAKTPGEKLARKILQKSQQSGVPGSMMWRSLAG